MLGVTFSASTGAKRLVVNVAVAGTTLTLFVMTIVGAKVEAVRIAVAGIIERASLGAKVERVSEAIGGTGTAKPVGEPVANGF